MRGRFLLIVLSLAVGYPAYAQDVTPEEPVAPATQSPYAQTTLSPAVAYGGFKTYHITMTTRLVIPNDGRTVTGLRVWHAMPPAQPWSNTDTSLGATDISCSPATAIAHHDAKWDAYSRLWNITQPLPRGVPLNFSSQLTVRSAARSLKVAGLHVKWPENFTPPQDVPDDIAKVADAIKATHDPITAVVEFCRVIAHEIQYDASVPYPPSDIDSILRYRRGHCGHRFAVFKRLCYRVGIPVRSIVGLNLGVPDGLHGSLAAIRADYTNVHTWGEVYFEGVGWVEVEPAATKNPYYIPARYIQNNRWYQNYVVWVNENNKWKMTKWDNTNGHYTSEYNLANTISFKFSATPSAPSTTIAAPAGPGEAQDTAAVEKPTSDPALVP